MTGHELDQGVAKSTAQSVHKMHVSPVTAPAISTTTLSAMRSVIRQMAFTTQRLGMAPSHARVRIPYNPYPSMLSWLVCLFIDKSNENIFEISGCSNEYCWICPNDICVACNSTSYLHNYSVCNEECNQTNGFYNTTFGNGTITCQSNHFS